MSYSPTTWETGDTITAEKLNKMEGGIEDANNFVVFSVDAELGDGEQRLILHASAAELIAAWTAGKRVYARGHFDLEEWSINVYVQFTLLFVGNNLGSTVAKFAGFEPFNGYEYVDFIPDASDATMSTDGGYVPST